MRNIKSRAVLLVIALALSLITVAGCGAAVSETLQSAPPQVEKKVTSVNAYMQLLDSKNLPTGDQFNEKAFGNQNEKISVYVSAVIPKGYEIDYWLINNAKYYFNKAVTAFTVLDLNGTTVYEAVLKKTAAVATVSISCINARFTGGGYTNATSGTVPKGTKLTITGIVDIGNPTYWEINGTMSDSYFSKKTITYTVNGNTTFKYTGFN
jgi:hypothetical protein